MTVTLPTTASPPVASNLPSVCALIVSYNRLEQLRECIRAVLAQTRVPERIVVIDNASEDGTYDAIRLEFPQLEVLHLQVNTGPAGGFSKGFERALQSGLEYVWTLDDDCVPEPDALEVLLQTLVSFPKESRPRLLSSYVIWKDGTAHPMNRPVFGISWRQRERWARRDGLASVRATSFVSTLISLQSVAEHGLPWAAYYFWNDDVEYTARLLRDAQGYAVPNSKVMHLSSRPYVPLDDRSGRYFYEVRNKLWMVRFSNAWSLPERIGWGVYLSLSITRHLIHNNFSLESRGVVQRGLEQGLWASPQSQPQNLAQTNGGPVVNPLSVSSGADAAQANLNSSSSNSSTGGSKNHLRILMVSARYLPSIGGTERHTFEVSRRLAAQGHDVSVLTTDLDGTLPALEHADGVQVIRVPAYPKDRDYFFAPKMFGIIANGNWDLVHCQGYHTLVAPLSMLAATWGRYPYVLSFHSGGHSSAARNAMRYLQSLMLRPLLARAKQLIGVSKAEVSLFQERLRLPEAHFMVIPNGAQLPTVPEQRIDAQGTLIVSVGRLEQYKGHHRVIAALPKVLEQCPDARLRVVGSGPYESELRQLAKSLNIADRVEIAPIPADDRTGMAKLLASAAVVTLLSEYESHGVAVLEALVLHRPVLVTYASALREFADDGFARSVTLEADANEVARQILLQIREPLQQPALELPTWDGCAEALLAVYQDVLSDKVRA
jgi:glycosyltransferase involved in cell wall biosynthesis/GT2 family glycosyltransferase